LFTDATLIGAAGGSDASGGKLIVSSGIRYIGSGTAPPTDATLQVTQSGPVFATAGSGQTVLGNPVVAADGRIVSLTDTNSGTKDLGGFFTIDRWASGGFGSLELDGSVAILGPGVDRGHGNSGRRQRGRDPDGSGGDDQGDALRALCRSGNRIFLYPKRRS